GEGRVQGICRYLCAPDRYHAARVLSSVGEAARPARKVLLEYQMDESGGVRERVAEALLNLGEPLSDVLHPLLDGLHSQDMSERERMRFIEPLLKHGIPHEQLLPSLIRIISESSDFSTKVEALEVLGKMGRSALSAAETIEEAISEKSDEFDIKINAVQALTRIGAKESVATPILLSALDEELDSDVKAEILHDLSRIESLNKGTLDRILTELDDDDSSVRAAAAFVLAKNKVQIVRCLKILSKTLDEVDDEVRWRAAVALGSIGSSAESTVDQLVQFVRKEQSREIRLSGIWAIGQIGKYSNELKPLFSKISENADDDERRIIDKALRCLESNEQ
ncbi:MAG TPA: hypothetical protein DIT97_15475, partial [Gimesia maris]|nr:hypothetical protein [Gimesia maris]